MVEHFKCYKEELFLTGGQLYLICGVFKLHIYRRESLIMRVESIKSHTTHTIGHHAF